MAPNALVNTLDIDDAALYDVKLVRAIQFSDGKPRTPRQQHRMKGKVVKWIDDNNPGAIGEITLVR